MTNPRRSPLFARATRQFLCVALTVLGSQMALADWQLDNDASRLSFVTTKADNVAEVHRFDRISGSVSDDGMVNLSIELMSVNTAIPIRNERMQAMLFETNLFPRATVSGRVDAAGIAAMSVGESMSMSAEFSLDLHGQSAPITAELTVIKLSDGIHVATRAPIVVMAETFSLVAGVEKLREVAGLTRISNAVPVSISATFR